MEMQMEYIRKLPEPQELMEQFPIDDEAKAVKRKRDEAIKNILSGKDDRFLLIIGPCSADNERAVLDYIHRLVKVQEQVKVAYRSLSISSWRISVSATRKT